MADIKYEDLLHIMTDNDWSYDGTNFFAMGDKATAKQKATILSTLKVDEKTFKIAYAQHKKELNKNARGGKNHIENNYTNIQFIHPRLLTADWNRGDREFWGRFKFAARGDNVVLLISQLEGGYRVVEMGGRDADTIATIHQELQKTGANKSEYANLDIELTTRYRKLMEACAKAATDDNTLAEWACQYIPSTLLKKHPLMLCVYERLIEADEGNRTTLREPEMAFFQFRTGDLIDPVSHLVSDWESFLKLPDMKADMPKMFSNNPDEPALNFIDLAHLAVEGPCPTWDKYMERFSQGEQEVFKAFIYSIYNVNNTGRQLLYVYDKHGYSGKSVMLAAISSLLPPRIVQTLQKDSLSNQFGLAKLYGKRLITIPDNKNTKLVVSEKMHMVTGGDSADIEFKGRDSFRLDKLECRIIACGNTELEIDPDVDHEVTRLITIKPKMTEKLLKECCETDANGELVIGINGKYKMHGDANFAKNLIAEMPAFLFECKKYYDKLCPTDADIICPDDVLANMDDMIDPEVEVFGELLNNYFELGENCVATSSQLMQQFQHAIDELDIAKVQKLDFAHFRTHLKKRNLIRKTTCRNKGGGITAMVRGIAPKTVNTKFANTGTRTYVPSSSLQEPTNPFEDVLGDNI